METLTMYRTIEIPVGIDFLEVECECILRLENDGIGSYEYWGYKGYDKGQDYWVLEQVTFDHTAYPPETSEVIYKWINLNMEYIDSLCEGQEIKDYFDNLYDTE